jgi:hypothetical protein
MAGVIHGYQDECAGNAHGGRCWRGVTRSTRAGGRRGATATNCCPIATARILTPSGEPGDAGGGSPYELGSPAALPTAVPAVPFDAAGSWARRPIWSCWAMPTSCRAASTSVGDRDAGPQHEFVGKSFIGNYLRITAPCCSVGTSPAMPSARERVFWLLGPSTKTEVWRTWPERSFRRRRPMF